MGEVPRTGLNIAKIELSVFERNCLGQKVGDVATLKQQVAALEDERNARSAKVNWQFTNAKAREKMQHRYSTYQSIVD